MPVYCPGTRASWRGSRKRLREKLAPPENYVAASTCIFSTTSPGSPAQGRACVFCDTNAMTKALSTKGGRGNVVRVLIGLKGSGRQDVLERALSQVPNEAVRERYHDSVKWERMRCRGREEQPCRFSLKYYGDGL